MDATTFTRVVQDFFETWLKSIAVRIDKGEIQIIEPYSYPTMLRVGESPSHFIAELLGETRISASKKAYKLQVPNTPETFPDTAAFFNPGFDSGARKRACLQFLDSI